MSRSVHWADRPKVRPAKLGTVPVLIEVHGSDVRKIEVGGRVRVREGVRVPWVFVRVTRVDDTGYFFGERV